MAERLKHQISVLPYASAYLPGIGGRIKAMPEHFQVEEMLPYAPSGEGEHVFVKLQRQGRNTVDVAHLLARAFQLKAADVGWAGRKDRQAVVAQTFSLRLPLDLPVGEVASTLRSLPFSVLAVQRHRHKLKTGHVAGNRFRILLTDVSSEAENKARAIADALKARGVPNFFGPQRFGIEMRNLDRATHLIHRRRIVRGKKEMFMISALQGALFNCWLKARMQENYFNRIIIGDVAQKTDTGGLFVVDEVDEANTRFQRGMLTYTGPLYGFKMMTAKEYAADREKKILDTYGLDFQAFKPMRAPGSRRTARLQITDLSIRANDSGLEFNFTMPAGAYATTVMREFTRSSMNDG